MSWTEKKSECQIMQGAKNRTFLLRLFSPRSWRALSNEKYFGDFGFGRRGGELAAKKVSPYSITEANSTSLDAV